MSRGAWVPRSVVRPSAASDRGPVVLRPRVDRRESASGLGSRVPWRGVASWAGRSASSGLSGILSCRPRGDLVSTPRGTQTRRAPDSARRVFVRRMIRPASKGCQTSRDRARAARSSHFTQETGSRLRPVVGCVQRKQRRQDASARSVPGQIVRHKRRSGLRCSDPCVRSKDLTVEPLRATRRRRWLRLTQAGPPSNDPATVVFRRT